jgi:hypothetical protein
MVIRAIFAKEWHCRTQFSFYSNESMMDTQQIRALMGDDMVQKLKKLESNEDSTKDSRYAKFPDDGSPWGYGRGANLINWNYDASSGGAVQSTINLVDKR